MLRCVLPKSQKNYGANRIRFTSLTDFLKQAAWAGCWDSSRPTATRESSFAPSYHFVADLGTDHAWTNLPGGASESRFSKWYRNGIERWLAGEYHRLDA